MQTLLDPIGKAFPLLVLFIVVIYFVRIYFKGNSSLKNNLSNDFSNKKSKKNISIVTPIRLQAYERICLFLERISPNNLLLRVTPNDTISVSNLQNMLLRDIREEFNHNLSQQIYISDQAWDKTVLAMQNVIVNINMASIELDPNGNSLELSKQIFSQALKNEIIETQEAIAFLKDEVRQLLY